jgi:uncharacterized cupin superfamily protein
MSAADSSKIRVIGARQLDWEEAMTQPGETAAPGREATVLRSADDLFSVGMWERDAQSRSFERTYHEVAYIIEGEVEVTEENGVVHIAKAGDILVTPQGSKGYWRNLTPVRKVWAIYEEAREMPAYLGPGAF